MSAAVIGRGAAVGVVFNRFSCSGALAWLAWLAIHITFLVGFRNRIAVIFNWAYVYLTRRRHAQLIVGAAPLTEGGAENPAALLQSADGNAVRTMSPSSSRTPSSTNHPPPRRAIAH